MFSIFRKKLSASQLGAFLLPGFLEMQAGDSTVATLADGRERKKVEFEVFCLRAAAFYVGLRRAIHEPELRESAFRSMGRSFGAAAARGVGPTDVAVMQARLESYGAALDRSMKENRPMLIGGVFSQNLDGTPGFTSAVLAETMFFKTVELVAATLRDYKIVS